MHVLEQVLGVSVVTLTVVLIFAAIRRMLRHSVGLWARRQLLDGANEYEYRFTVQNLESVPVDVELTATLIEEDFPSSEQPANLLHTRLRIFSGQTNPTFLRDGANVKSGTGQLLSVVTFPEMPAHDTWTIKVTTPARRVSLALNAAGAPVGRMNPLRPWLGVTLSASSITVTADDPVSRSPRMEPTWTTGAVVAGLGPALYVAAFVTLRQTLWLGRLQQDGHWSFLDCGIVGLLSLLGFLWYRSVRRAVYPTIQSYTRSVSPGEH
jgi:hypothetical protein